MNQRNLLIILSGLAIFFAGILCGLTIRKQSISGELQSVIENLEKTAHAEIITQLTPSQSIEMTPTSPDNVWIYCSECDGGPHVLWESPNEMGVDRPLANEGQQCIILERQITSTGISKVELLCGNFQGWLSAEGISFTAP